MIISLLKHILLYDMAFISTKQLMIIRFLKHTHKSTEVNGQMLYFLKMRFFLTIYHVLRDFPFSFHRELTIFQEVAF